MPVIAIYLNPQLMPADVNPLSIIAALIAFRSSTTPEWIRIRAHLLTKMLFQRWLCLCYVFMFCDGSRNEMNTSNRSFEELV